MYYPVKIHDKFQSFACPKFNDSNVCLTIPVSIEVHAVPTWGITAKIAAADPSFPSLI